MTRPDWIEMLRADVRPADPDPVLLAQLVELSSRSVAPASRPGRSAGARLAMVLGGVIAVGATSWAAGALPGTDSPFRPEESVSQQPTDPTPSHSPDAPPGHEPTPSVSPGPAGGTATVPSPGARTPDPRSGATPAAPSTRPGRGSSSAPPGDLPTLPQLPVTPDVPASLDPPGLERFPDVPPAPLPKSEKRDPGDGDELRIPPGAPSDDDTSGDTAGDTAGDETDSDSDSGRGRSPRPQGVPVDRTR